MKRDVSIEIPAVPRRTLVMWLLIALPLSSLLWLALILAWLHLVEVLA